MKYLSVCSGIEAASVAWHPLGWQPAAFCEIEAFPSAVLAHHYPTVPNYGDFTRLIDAAHPIRDAGVDLLVGGTPCQAFSVAGLRRGLADARGGLTLEFVRLAQALRPRWIVWENVPGVLSQDGGRAFGAFLGALGELGYGWAYRVLDAQWFRVAQRRRRVFVVACAGGRSERAAAVLFEPEGVRRDPPTRGEAWKGATAGACGGVDGGSVAGTVSSKWAKGTGGPAGDEHYNLTVAFDTTQITSPLNRSVPKPGDPCHPLAAGAHPPAVATLMAVRRLTPRECERLQGFPDDYTRIPYKKKSADESPDGPRYKALGNSMAVPVMRWIGERIAKVEQV